MSKIKDNGKNSFVFYDSFLSAMKHLNDAEFRECVLKIRDYALEGVDEESSSSMVNVIMAMAKPNLDSARRRYMASVENGKKGAEFGKLGGAPKGNLNARKKQPLIQPQIQPLDVDVNEDVEEDVNKEVNVNGDDDGDNPSGTIGFQSSFSNSSIGFQEEEIKNDSERLEQSEEKKEPLQEVNQYHSNELRVGAANQEKEEKPLYSKSDNLDSAAISPGYESSKVDAATQPKRKKELGMDIGKYLHQCYDKNLQSLAKMRLGYIPKDDALFWRTVDIHKQIYPSDDNNAAIKYINKILNNVIESL